MWMCDRPIPQQNLCNELADLIFVLPRDAVVPWLRGFWATMSREWTGIDVLRMEKFLLLVRRVVGAGFRWMKKDGKQGKSGRWADDRADDILGLLAEWPLSLEDEAPVTGEEVKDEDALSPQTIPAGLRIQVLDVWVDEAEKVGLLDEDDEEAKKILWRIVGAVDLLEQRTTRPGVRIRSKDSLADERLLKKGEAGLEGDDTATKDVDMKSGDEEEGWGGFDD